MIFIQSLCHDVREIREEAKTMHSKAVEIENNLKSLMMECRTNEAEFVKTQVQLMKDSKAVGRLNIEIAELQSIEDPEPVDITALVRSLVQIFVFLCFWNSGPSFC